MGGGGGRKTAVSYDETRNKVKQTSQESQGMNETSSTDDSLLLPFLP